MTWACLRGGVQHVLSCGPPSRPRLGSSLYMSSYADTGATSLKSITVEVPVEALYTTMKPPPPIPVECKLTTPRQIQLAMAASTAVPPFQRMSVPITEHWAASAATAACLYK